MIATARFTLKLTLWAVFCSLLFLPSIGKGEAPATRLLIKPGGTDPEGRKTFDLEWNAVPDTLYRLQTRDRLEAGTAWETLDVVKPTESTARFKVAPDKMEAGAEGIRRQFIRLLTPQPEIHRVEPAVGPTSGGTFFLVGQCLNTNGQLRIRNLVIPPNTLQAGSLYSFRLPEMPEGTYDVEWVEDGRVVARKYKLFSITAEVQPVGARQRLLEPPNDPPAAPKTSIGDNGWGSCFNCHPFGPAVGTISAWDKLSLLLHSQNSATGVRPASGELTHQSVDLHYTSRGLDFTFVRTYRSRTGRPTPMGNRWDHNYNVYLEQVGSDIALYDGTGRRDVYFQGSNGLYSANEIFNEMTVLPNGRVKVKFPWLGSWEFREFDGSPSQGKLEQITDRNGNSMRLFHDIDGRLQVILDTLGRTNFFTYNPAGLIEGVTDFTGRRVTFSYHEPGSAGGSPGDLASAVSPPVTGTPNGNDFPSGKRTAYNYSRGFADDRENHLLVNIVDNNGDTPYRFAYQHNQTDLEFLRLTGLQRGGQEGRFVFAYFVQDPSPQNRYAVMKCIINQPGGNVMELMYDSLNRNIVHRDLAARAVHGQRVTETENRPTKKVRDSDPDFWETRRDWNLDSLQTRVQLPKGNTQEFVYERDFDPEASPIHKGDLRVARSCCADLDQDGDLDLAVTRFDYDPRFGSPAKYQFPGDKTPIIKGSALSGAARYWGPRQSIPMEGSFTTKSVDERGNVYRSRYDDRGNLLESTPPFVVGNDAPELAQTQFGYNQYGQLTEITEPANGSGHRTHNLLVWDLDDGSAMVGRLLHVIQDPDGAALRTSYEYDLKGNIRRVVDPRGYDEISTFNALNQLVQWQGRPVCDPCSLPIPPRPKKQFYYDGKNNLIQTVEDNLDETGAVVGTNPTWVSSAEYDVLNRPTMLAHELTHVIQQGGSHTRSNRFFYDGMDNLVLHQLPEAVTGTEPANTISYEYDTRQFLFRQTRASGSPLRSGLQWDYDGNGNVQRYHTDPYVETSQRALYLYEYDGLDRRIRGTDAMGNADIFRYDAAGNLVYHRCDGETNDALGGLDNLRLSESRFEYDNRNQCVRVRRSFFEIATQTPLADGESIASTSYAPNGQIVSETDDNGHTTRYTYDAVNRLSTVTDPRGNSVLYTYDSNGNVLSETETAKSDLLTEDQTFVLTYTYDPLNRLLSRRDTLGNTESHGYDSRGNRVSTIDPRGNETLWTYDGLNRVVDTIPYEGRRSSGITINTSHVEYQNDRRISVTDGNGNTTRYFYDALDRQTRVRYADGTEEQFSYDARNNLTQSTDANGTTVTRAYDLLDRCVRKDISLAPGSLVLPATTFELFSYDGLSHLVLASNNVSMLEYAYDSLEAREKAKQDCIAAFARHDGVGNVLSLAYPNGSVAEFSYDALNRVTRVDHSQIAGQRPRNLATFSYEGASRLAMVSRAGGINSRIRWSGIAGVPNAPGDFGWKQVRRVRHGNGAAAPVDDRALAYDAAQNKTGLGVAGSHIPGGSVLSSAFTYDGGDRLIRSTRTQDGVVQSDNRYVLDTLGNRTNVIRLDGVDNYSMLNATPEPADAQMSQYTFSPLGGHTYDQNGNLIALDNGGNETIFRYDYMNRLVEVQRTAGPALASFTYDALGRRISKTTYPPAPSAPFVEQYIHGVDDDCDGFIEQWENGATKATVVFPHALEVSGRMLILNTGEVLYHLNDDQGNVVALLNANGQVLERYAYGDYGSPRFLSSDGAVLVDAVGNPVTSSPAGNPFLFRGMLWDSEFSMFYGHSQGATHGIPARYLDPRDGRHTTRIWGDPHVDEGDGGKWDFTRRNFAGNNPWSQQKAIRGGSAAVGAPKKSFGSKIGRFAKVTVRGWDPKKKEEGGRHTPFHNKYRPSAYSKLIWSPRSNFALLPGEDGRDCDDSDARLTGWTGTSCTGGGVLTAREAGSGMATGRGHAPLVTYAWAGFGYRGVDMFLCLCDKGQSCSLCRKRRASTSGPSCDSSAKYVEWGPGKLTYDDLHRSLGAGQHACPACPHPATGLRMREGGRTVGAGQVTEIVK